MIGTVPDVDEDVKGDKWPICTARRCENAQGSREKLGGGAQPSRGEIRRCSPKVRRVNKENERALMLATSRNGSAACPFAGGAHLASMHGLMHSQR